MILTTKATSLDLGSLCLNVLNSDETSTDKYPLSLLLSFVFFKFKSNDHTVLLRLYLVWCEQKLETGSDVTLFQLFFLC